MQPISESISCHSSVCWHGREDRSQSALRDVAVRLPSIACDGRNSCQCPHGSALPWFPPKLAVSSMSVSVPMVRPHGKIQRCGMVGKSVELRNHRVVSPRLSDLYRSRIELIVMPFLGCTVTVPRKQFHRVLVHAMLT